MSHIFYMPMATVRYSTSWFERNITDLLVEISNIAKVSASREDMTYLVATTADATDGF